MLPRLGCLFIVVPLVELALLIQVGRWVGVWPTVGLVAVTGLLGMTLVRHEGMRTLARVQSELDRGRMPGGALMDGACLLVGGALLLTPGVLTDAFALALLFTPTRRLLQGWALARIGRAVEEGKVHVHFGGMMGGMGGGGPLGRRGPGGGGAGGEGRGPGRERRGEEGRPGGPGSRREDDDEDEGPGPGPRPGEIVQE